MVTIIVTTVLKGNKEMEERIMQSILAEINLHTQDDLNAIDDFCTKQGCKLSISKLGQAIADEFNIPRIVGIKLAIAAKKYLIWRV